VPREAISSNAIAPTGGPFSPAVRAGEFVFLSGQVAQLPTTGKLLAGDASAQTEQIFKNLDVVRVAVHLTDMKDFEQMNAVYVRNFEPPYPARTTVAVAALPMGALVEIDLVAR
jgi:2-iminobutanoate/2-iminopropanoate deaminase